MKVYSWEDVLTLAPIGASAVTIGGFDGMHLGHQALFDAVFDWKKRAAANFSLANGSRATARPGLAAASVLAGVVTFKRPAGALMNPSYPGDLSTEKQKLKFFEKRGFDFCVMIDFSQDFSKIEGRNFLDQLRKFCSAQFLAAGSDFRCGHNLDTGVAELSDYSTRNGLELKVLDDITLDGKRVSSSLIRGAVLQGDFALAKKLLGAPYRLDCSSIEWKASSSDSSLSLIANVRTAQVLPKAGRHPVGVVFDGKKSSAFFYAEGQFLRLEFPLGQKDFSTIQEIEFL